MALMRDTNRPRLWSHEERARDYGHQGAQLLAPSTEEREIDRTSATHARQVARAAVDRRKVPVPIPNCQYVIQKGVPIPPLPKRTGGPRSRQYPFHEMEVGDSFVASPRVCQASTEYGSRYGKKFTTRRVDDVFVRVWRIR